MHLLRRAAEVAALVALAASPFVLYGGIRAAGGGDEPLPWPADVAVASERGGNLSEFWLLHYGPPNGPLIVRFEPEARLEVPGSGQLRAESAYRIGGADALAAGLSGVLGVEVPYAVAGPSDRAGLPPAEIESHNLRDRAPEVAAVLQEVRTGTRRAVEAPGRPARSGRMSFFALDVGTLSKALRVASLGEAVRILSPRRTAPRSPPTRKPRPADVQVESLNAGAPDGSATTVAEVLRKDGFKISRIGDVPAQAIRKLEAETKKKVAGVTVYYRTDRSAGALVVERLEARKIPVEGPLKLPRSLEARADVLIVVARKV